MELPDLQHLSPEDRELILESQQKIMSGQDEKMLVAMESFADLLDKLGMHSEARKYFQNIFSSTSDNLTQARCLRKIAYSSLGQRNYMDAAETAEKAAAFVRQLPMKDKGRNEEYVRILHVSANSYYFQLKFEKLEAIVKEIKIVLPDITDIELRCNLLNAISIAIYVKYRWYQFPEEAFTHLELQLQLTSQLADKFHHGYTHCIAGHFHMFNEEFTIAREHFSKGIQLLGGKNFHALLMAYNYTAVSYRMQNNISMTEQWALLTLEKAKQTSNFSYVPYSYANLSWVNAKRKNWLYAEDYARKAADDWSAIAISCSYAFPLMNCLLQKGEFNEAGQLAFKLLHPRLKRLPGGLTEKLRRVAKAWVSDNKIELGNSLEDVIDEAKLTGYF
jgi:tetratricopeptide (TPR) repeat protein